jgi:hypothetical protein
MGLLLSSISEQRSLFLAFSISFFVRRGIPFLRPDPQYCKAGARRSCQGWLVERRDVEFGVDGGDRLRGWLFLPSKRAGPLPISVAHGYAGVKEHGLELLVLGATDRRIRAVVSQVPTISGYEQGLRRVPPDAVAAREHQFDEDERAQLRGEPPRLQQVVNAEIGLPPGPDPRPERSQQP